MTGRTGARSLRIVVDVDPGSTPLVGRLSAPLQPARDFVGLVELLAAVEELVKGVDQLDPDATPAEPS